MRNAAVAVHDAPSQRHSPHEVRNRRLLVIAHRANLNGAEPQFENTLDRTRECIARGWSVETDIRRDTAGRFYVSHDRVAWSAANDAAAFCALWREARVPIALNVKELGYEADLIAFLRAHEALSHVFLFDMELLESTAGDTARRFRSLDADVCLGARVSDRREPVEQALAIDCTQIVWLDEFESPWASMSDVRLLQAQGRLVYAVSPELHGSSLSAMQRRWTQWIAWGVDGICTDAPTQLHRMLTESPANTQTPIAA